MREVFFIAVYGWTKAKPGSLIFISIRTAGVQAFESSPVIYENALARSESE